MAGGPGAEGQAGGRDGAAARRRPRGRVARAVAGIGAWPRPVRALLAVLVLGGLMGGAALLGFSMNEHEFGPHRFLDRVDARFERTFFARQGTPRRQSGEYPTHLVRLVADVAAVPTGRTPGSGKLEGVGGGLTSFAGDVLVLAFDGTVYAAASSQDVRATRVRAPDNNRAALGALMDDPRFDAYEFRPGYLRYNDLIRIDTAGGPALIASYTEFHPDRACVTNTLARLDLDPAAASIDAVEAGPADWRVILRTEPCLPLKRKHLAVEGHMAGGRLAFAAPATLYMTSGDFHWDGMRSEPGPGIAQDPSAEYGKILAVDPETGARRIVSLGHRNPQGIVVTPDGRLLEVEHGPRGGDELNLIREGANYGWPLESYGTTYKGASRIPGSLSFARHERFEAPLFAWLPSVATSDIALVRGFHPAWDGDLLVASLVDQSLFRLRLAGDRVVYGERIEIGTRIRDVHQHADGRLVLWTDNEELMFLTASDRSNMMEVFADFVRREKIEDGLATKLEAAIERCAECHSFDIGDHQKAPGLARIYDDPIAGTAYAAYSDGLRAQGGTWTRDALAAFLGDPAAFAPGTTMPNPMVGDPEVLEGLIGYLEHIDQAF